MEVLTILNASGCKKRKICYMMASDIFTYKLGTA